MKHSVLLALALLAALGALVGSNFQADAAVLKLGANSDLEIGGFGVSNGQFTRLRDMTFGTDGRLYTLESAGVETSVDGSVTGLGRVQVFDNNGQFQHAFSLGEDAQADHASRPRNEDGPMAAARIAVDGAHRIYVTFPAAGLVRVFDPAGAKLSDIPLPNAMALARRGDGKIIAIASRAVIGRHGWEWQGGESMNVLTATEIETTVPLAQTLWNVQMQRSPQMEVSWFWPPARSLNTATTLRRSFGGLIQMESSFPALDRALRAEARTAASLCIPWPSGRTAPFSR